MKKNILLLVDLQNDFLPGGALAVPQGNEVIPIANLLMENSNSFFSEIIATQDWHPQNHKSFATNHFGKNIGEFVKLNEVEQMLWPNHCIQNSNGASFAANLNVQKIMRVFQKGQNSEVDSYSGFFDNDHKTSTGLGEYLKSISATDIYIMGLATEYCVKFTAIDSINLNFTTYLIIDGCRGINIQKNDISNAISEMKMKNIHICNSSNIL
ncbi:bifunctional nicotinamidase/pyrazinamidase [Fluviispira multicolorata]|uniref:Nicotinamidase n=1 Tax=Fluviispira multicolorata TaxID=2654512 RepID=A0A833N4X8_9BACT|nr:bifunctional nicotinamidase/pyrazinamidase [Fluviispira multicolorata]KAB8033307.1 bifunctional nicotinamidase/pyrazinamidase [Fluviispira multicolorata]